MASNKHKREDYPIVKYRIVDGNGYQVCNSEKELRETLKRKMDFYKELVEKGKYDIERFKPKYIIKVTEEYIEIN